MPFQRSNRSRSSASKISGAANRSSAALRSAVERMEQRLLMSATLDAAVPTSITPASVALSPFAPGVTSYSLSTSATQNLVTQSLTRFSVNNTATGQATVISTAPVAGNADLTDSAIAIFDKDGNRVAFVDADPAGGESVETLTMALQSNQPYELGIYGLKYGTTGSTIDGISISVNTGPQQIAGTVTTPASTGTGSILATGPTGFNSSTSTDFYAIQFTDGGPSGTVAITAGGPDTNVKADLYVQTPSGGPYTLVTSGTGTPSLNVTAPTGADLLDENYVLAVSPAGFTAAPEAFTITASSTSAVVPASISSMASTYTLLPTIQTVGLVSSATSGIYATGAGSVSTVTAPVSGPLTLTYVAGASLPPALSVYGSGGSTLIGASSSEVGGSVVSYTFNASAGSTYEILTAADATQSNTGFYNLNYQQSYTPTAVTATAAVSTQSALQIAPSSGAQFFRITPPVGANYLALQLSPDAGSTLTGKITVASASGASTTYNGSPSGGVLNVAVNLAVYTGAIDVEVSSTAGTGTASFRYAALSVAQTISIDQYPTSLLNVSTGSLTSTTLNLSMLGASAGIQYYAFKSAAPTTPTYTGQTAAGSSILLLHYSQIGGILQLQDATATNFLGTAATAPTVAGGEIQALVALSLNLTGGQSATVSVTNAIPTPVQVGMVPNALPGSTQTSGFASDLKINGAVFATSEQRDFYQTLLPSNPSGSTGTLTFTPGNIGGTLSANVAVYNSVGNQLASGTSAPGSVLTLSVPNLAAQAAITILVTPVSGSAVGNGLYSIDLNVATTDPRPFEFGSAESAFYPYAAANSSSPGYLPNGLVIHPLTLGGSDSGAFTSSLPYYSGGGTGSLIVYALNVSTAGPIQIYTTDNAAASPVNTTIALYSAQTSTSGSTYYQVLTGSSPNTDYYPADRSVVDSKIVDLYASGTIYIFVKNEQGTTGTFSIFAQSYNPPPLGPGLPDDSLLNVSAGSLMISPATGTGSLSISPSVFYNLLTPQNLTTFLTINRQSPPTLTLSFSGTSNGQSATLYQYGSDGTYITSNAATVSGNKATYNLSMGAGGDYYFTVLTNISGSISASASCLLLVNGGPVPATSDTVLSVGTGNKYGSAPEPYTRSDPSPLGSYTSTAITFGAKTGTLVKDIFWVGSTGTASIQVAAPSGASNLTFGLYQLVAYSEGIEFGSGAVGTLLDYANAVGSDGTYDFNVVLPEGAYYIKGTGTVPAQTNFVTITGQLPAYVASQITIDPVAGNNLSPLIDAAVNTSSQGRTGLLFATEFLEVTAPANSAGGPATFTVGGTSFDSGAGSFVNTTAWTASGPTITGIGSTGDTFPQVGRLVGGISVNGGAGPAVLTTSDSSTPGKQYFLAVDDAGFDAGLNATVVFNVYQSGTPDLVAEPIKLTGDHGQTGVGIVVYNAGYAQAAPSTGTVAFSNYNSTGTITIPAIGSLGFYFYNTTWIPNAPANTATFTADSKNVIGELNENNNVTTIALSTVDSALPTATIALSDPLMTAEGTAAASAGGGTWGRYVSGVKGQTAKVTVAASGAVALHDVSLGGGPFGYDDNDNFTALSTSVSFPVSFDFGSFSATSASNTNQISFDATDVYGLTFKAHYQKLDIAPKSDFLTTETFSLATHQFTLGWVDNIINESDTLDSLLGTTLPIVGNSTNQFLVALSSSGTATLDPTVAISLPLTGQIMVEALNDSIYNQTFNGSSQPTKALSIHTTLAISGKTLSPTAAAVSIQLAPINLYTYTSPKTTLFTYGIPDIASVDVDFSFAISANISAGVKVGLNPSFLTDPLTAPFDLGIMSPTYVQPSLTATSFIDAQVSILGFDAADLYGNVGLTLTMTLGLDNNNQSALFPLNQVSNNIALAFTGQLNFGFSAHVWGLGQVWSYNYPVNLGNILYDSTKQGIITSDPADGGKLVTVNGIVGAVQSAITTPSASPVGTVNTSNGSTLVGTVPIDPRPQIVINDTGAANGSSPTAIATQVVNVGSASTPLGNIEVSTRTNGTWSGQTVLSEPDDVGTPALALTHDAAGTVPAVLTYVADNVAGAPAGQTLNQRADALDVRYRYFNGTTWSGEQSVTNDNLYDSDPTVSFNNTGSGILAYVHNTDPAPFGTTVFDAASNDIAASVWNATTHTWSAPVSITSNDGFDDSKPATFVDSSGKQYVVWIREGANGDATNQLMFSVYSGTSWSAAAILPITGLSAGGSFGDVTVGSDASGRVDVVFSYRTINSDSSENSILYNRPTTVAAFTSAATLVEISQDQNYSYLQSTVSPTGALVVSWEQSNGVDNQVFASDVTNIGGVDSAFTTPTQLTDNPDVTVAPSVAVDAGGQMQILYDHDLEPGQTTAGTATDPSVGVPLASGVSSSSLQMLPQFSFQNGLYFNAGSAAPTGTQLAGSAVIVNRGLVSAQVTISAYTGKPGSGTSVGTPTTITLGPGDTYNVSQLFTVLAGSNTYSIQLTTPGAQEVDTTENLSVATLTGQADLSLISVTPSVTSPVPGQSFNLVADIRDLSTANIGTFTVSLSSGDPRFPQVAPVLMSTQNVSSVAGGQDVFVSFPITLPDAAGNYVYTIKADSNNVISESNEANNDGQYTIEFLADPAVTSVVPTLLNYSGGANVQVVATVVNNGQFPLNNIPIDLVSTVQNGQTTRSLDSQSYSIPTLGPGASTTVTFATYGQSGNDSYQVLIDPSAEGYDANLSNNSITSSLTVQALPTLNVSSVSASTMSPHQNDPLTIYATVSTIGIGEADNVLVQLQATPTGGGTTLILGSTTIPVVFAMNYSSVSFNVSTAALLGSYTFTVVADPNQQILQTTQAYDSASITLTVGPALPKLNLSGSTFYLRLDPDGTHLDVYTNTTGTGSPTQYVESNLGAINITGSAGNDSVTVDISNGNPIPMDQLNYIGGATAGGLGNVLYAVDHTGPDAFDVLQGQVQLTPFFGSEMTGIINETNIQYVRLSPGTGSSLAVQAGASAQLAAANTGNVAIRNFSYIFVRAGAFLGIEAAANTSSRSLIQGNLIMDPTGQLDLTNNDLDIQGGSLSQVQSLLTSGYNLSGGGNWAGPGIVSSVATHTTTLGYLLNNTPSGNPYYGTGTALGLFDGYSPSAGDILIKYTYYGDANLSGKVDGSDYSLIDGGYKTGSTWVAGDFNYDGVVDGSDYALLDNAFNNQAAGLGNVAAEVAAESVLVEPGSAGSKQMTLSAVDSRENQPSPYLLPAGTFGKTPVFDIEMSKAGRSLLIARATPAVRLAEPIFSATPFADALLRDFPVATHRRATKAFPAKGGSLTSENLMAIAWPD